jgi:hypothetical protein
VSFSACIFASVLALASPPVATLIDQLGSDDWSAREAAQRDLVRAGRDAVAPIEAALETLTDLEVRSRLETALTEIAEARMTGASQITLDAEAMPLAQVVELINQQADADLLIMPAEFWGGQMPGPVTMKVERASFWQTVEQLERAANVTVAQTPEGWRVMRDWGGRQVDGRSIEAGAFQFFAVSAQLTRSRNFGRGQGTQENFGLQLAVRAEPKIRLASGQAVVTITRAVDDLGNQLFSAQESMPIFLSVDGPAHFHLPLRFPAGGGTQIAELAGRIELSVTRESVTLQLDDLASSTEVEQRVGGAVVRLKPVGPDPANPQAHRVRISVEAADDQMVMARIQEAIHRARATDARGRSLVIQGFEVQRSDGQSQELIVAWGPGAQDVTRPLRLRIDIPTRFQPVEADFVFRDLPLP